MESDRPLLADLQKETTNLVAELREMFRLRWLLAQMELRSDVAALRRLAIGLSVAAIMALTALPLVVVWATKMLDGWLGISQDAWLISFGAALLLTAAGLGWLVWRRFRRQWLGLDETLTELREDLVWLEEWTSRGGS